MKTPTVADGRRTYAPYRVICVDCMETYHIKLQAADALLTTQCPECESTCILVEPDVKEKE